MRTLEIKELNLDENLILKLSGRMDLMPIHYLSDCKGERVIISSTPDKDIASIAFIHPIEKEQYIKEYGNIIPYYDFVWIRDNIIDKVKNNGIWLGVLESLIKDKGYGTEILNTLKNEYDFMIVFADGGADYYWLKQGFKGIGTGMYLWSKHEMVLWRITSIIFRRDRYVWYITRGKRKIGIGK